jgi:hypothetical protein
LAGTSGHAAGRAPGNTAQHTPPEPTHTAAPDGSLDASGDWQAYAQLLLMSNAFLFVD